MVAAVTGLTEQLAPIDATIVAVPVAVPDLAWLLPVISTSSKATPANLELRYMAVFIFFPLGPLGPLTCTIPMVPHRESRLHLLPERPGSAAAPTARPRASEEAGRRFPGSSRGRSAWSDRRSRPL